MKTSRGHVPAERRQPLKIEVPDQKQETLRFGRVGLIVTAGFAIGILWPRVAGFKLVPSVPSQPADSSNADLTGAPADPKAGSAPASSAAAAELEPPPPDATPNTDRLQISEPQFVVCRTKGKKKKDDCDHVDFDRLARPHIQALAACQGADRMQGVLSLGFELDFESQTIKAVKNGKSTTLAQPDVDALMACEKKELSNVSLVGISHQNQSYSVFYKVDFPKPGAAQPGAGAAEPAAEPAPGEVTEATGHATVAWDVALVRSSASRDGTVIARVLQGTRISVTGRRGDWYRIKYDVKGNVGWVYRTAIGM
ncbi:MAG TPA: SH3 domain-containing protein [Polyangiaceae bacterium]